MVEVRLTSISYPGEFEFPIDVDLNIDVSKLAKRNTHSSFPTRRSHRLVEKVIHEGSTSRKSRTVIPPQVPSHSTDTDSDTDYVFSAESSETETSSPVRTQHQMHNTGKTYSEIPDDTPLKNFIPKSVLSRITKVLSDKEKPSTSENRLQQVTPLVTDFSSTSSSSDERYNLSSDSDSEVCPFSTQFYSVKHFNRWAHFKDRVIRSEKVLDVSSCVEYGIVDFLTDRRLLESVTQKGPFVENVIKMFYANLSSDIDKVSSQNFGKVFLYNKVYSFSPSVINDCVGRNVSTNVMQTDCDVYNKDTIVEYLTGGILKKWVPRCPASRLTALFTTLHKLATYNWLPSMNESIVTSEQAALLFKIGKGLHVDLGQLIFRQVASLAEKESSSILPFPFLIYQILLDQGFQPSEEDTLGKDPELYTIPKVVLRSRDRVIDLPWQREENVAPNVDNISDNTSAGISSMSTVWLIAEKARIDKQLAGVDAVRTSLMHARDQIDILLSSQKGGVSAAHTAAGGTASAADGAAAGRTSNQGETSKQGEQRSHG